MNPKLKQNLIDFLKDFAVAAVIAAVILVFIMPTVVNQNSMESTLMPKDYLFVSRQAYRLFGTPERGDIIIFQSNIYDYEHNNNKLLVKRIIAVPGDTISISMGKVYLNGVALEEEYTKDGYTNGNMEETTIPEGYYFCMGDNRLVSLDSRSSEVGLVAKETIKGKVMFRLFPLNRFGRVD